MKKQWIVLALVALSVTLLLSNFTDRSNNFVVQARSLKSSPSEIYNPIHLPKFFGNNPQQSLQLLTRQEDCLTYDRTVEPSAKKRTVILKQFGLKVEIPDNYRTLLSNDGEVWILNPVDYDLIACTARGGRGGRGLYYNYISSFPNPNNLSLRTLISNNSGSEQSIKPYQFSGLNGLLIEMPEEALGSASFFVEIPGIENIVEISARCDCNVTANEIIDFLKTISLL